MNLHAEIRFAVMRGEADTIRSLLLTQEQCDLVRTVGRQGEVTASWLSRTAGVSIQNASSKLNRLSRAGYLQRKSRAAVTGGLEFVFTAAPGVGVAQ